MVIHARELVQNDTDVGESASKAMEDHHCCSISNETFDQGIRSSINVSPPLFSSQTSAWETLAPGPSNSEVHLWKPCSDA